MNTVQTKKSSNRRRTVICAALGIVLALALAEIGLRLVLNECEANGNYWGRGAFVNDPELGYRHAPNVTASVGRYGSFGPHAITFNSGGYRDVHKPPSSTSAGPRILVTGASFVVGLGLEHDRDLFSVRLEELLRADGAWPPDVSVYSIAQTGYWTDQVCALTQRELKRYRPSTVVMSIPGRVAVDADDSRRDVPVVNGYRLSKKRMLPIWPLDRLRTQSYVYMRCARSKLIKSISEALLELLGRRLHEESAVESSSVPPCLTALRDRLDRDRIGLLIMLVADPSSLEADDLEKALLVEGFDLVRVPLGSPWSYGNDGHWNQAGHLNAARIVAPRLKEDPPTAAAQEHASR